MQTFSMLHQRLRPLMAPWKDSKPGPLSAQGPTACHLPFKEEARLPGPGAACRGHTQEALSHSPRSASSFTESPGPCVDLADSGEGVMSLAWSLGQPVTRS